MPFAMNLLLDAIVRHLPKANKKAHDFSDVESIARKEHIALIVTEYRPDILGYYTTRRSSSKTKKFLMINALLRSEADRAFVGLHELGHHFLHAPISWRVPFYCRRICEATRSKYDSEADAFALIAMVPQQLLFEMQEASVSNIPPEMLPFLVRRQKLWELHGI